MNRIGKSLKRFFAKTLIAVTLFTSLFSSYQQGATAYASAVVPIVEGLAYLFELALAGSGIAVGVDDFNKLYDNYNWEDWCNVLTSGMTTAEKEEYEQQCYAEFTALQGVKTGDTINLKDYKHIFDSMKSYASHCVTLGNVKGDTVTYTNDNLSGLSLANKYLGGGMCADSFVSETFVNAGNFCLVYRSAEGSGVTFNEVKHPCYRILTLPSSNFDDYVLYRYPVSTDVYALRLVTKDTFTGSGLGTFYSEIVWKYPNTGLLERWSGSILSGVGRSSYLYLNEEGQTIDGWDLVAFHCNYPVYDQATAEIAKNFVDTPFYSFLENALVLPDTITIGTLDGITAVDDTIAGNPDATDEELAAAVTQALSDQIAKEQEIKDAVDDNTDAIVTGNSWLEKIFNLLTGALNSIISALSATGLLGTISSSLSKMLSFPKDIATELGKVLSIENVVSAIQALPQSIADALDISIDFTDVVSAITALPDAISGALDIPIPDLGVLDDILAGVLAIPGALDIPVPDLGILDDILSGILAIPGALDIPIPDLGVLDDILEGILAIPDVLLELLLFDAVAVQVHADALEASFNDKFPFFFLIADLFVDLPIPDYDKYPVIAVKTPKIIKQFYEHDSIVLFNGEDFAEYFVYVRNIARVMIWAAFGYSLLCHFKTRFNIG